MMRASCLLYFLLKVLLLAFLIIPASVSALQPPFELPPTEELAKIRSATLNTTKGSINFELFPEAAPWHVANFKYLADKEFYKGKQFHIMVDDFIIQAGTNNNKQFTYFLPPEFSPNKHSLGTLGMARAPDELNPQRNSSSTQFHILLADAARMDGSYTIFGQLISGEKTLQSLKRGGRIIDLKVFVSDQ